jgi:hypothetical protein
MLIALKPGQLHQLLDHSCHTDFACGLLHLPDTEIGLSVGVNSQQGWLVLIRT